MAGKTMFDAPKVIGLKVSQLISLLGRWPGNLRAVDLEVSSLERRMKQVHRWGWYRWGWVPSRWHGMVVEILTDGPLNLDPWRGPQFWMFAKRNLQHFDFWSFRSKNHQKSIWVENLSCILKCSSPQPRPWTHKKLLFPVQIFCFRIWPWPFHPQKRAEYPWCHGTARMGHLLWTCFRTSVAGTFWVLVKMDVSENRGWEHPQIMHFNKVLTIINHPFWGTQLFWKHPNVVRKMGCDLCLKSYLDQVIHQLLNLKFTKGFIKSTTSRWCRARILSRIYGFKDFVRKILGSHVILLITVCFVVHSILFGLQLVQWKRYVIHTRTFQR